MTAPKMSAAAAPPVAAVADLPVPEQMVASVTGTNTGAVAGEMGAAAPAPRIVGLDLSLTSTGICVIAELGITVMRVRSEPPKTPRHPRTGKPLPPTLDQRRGRLHKIFREIRDIISATDPHLIVVEAPAYSKSVGSMHDRSGLWWLIVEEIHAIGIPIAEITGGGRAKYATGKGTASKDTVLAAVVRRYPNVETSGNDEADALVLAAMGARHLGAPIDDLPKVQLEAMDAVVWPVTS